jgi:hypothetical protein
LKAQRLETRFSRYRLKGWVETGRFQAMGKRDSACTAPPVQTHTASNTSVVARAEGAEEVGYAGSEESNFLMPTVAAAATENEDETPTGKASALWVPPSAALSTCENVTFLSSPPAAPPVAEAAAATAAAAVAASPAAAAAAAAAVVAVDAGALTGVARVFTSNFPLALRTQDTTSRRSLTCDMSPKHSAVQVEFQSKGLNN